MLDELLNAYCKNYCPDYYLDSKTEDWAIFEAIKNQYVLYDLSQDDIENYQRGTADAAFVYYIDKTELCKCFDNPYQAEYSTYKQVFFVEKNLEDKSDNPLNAIPHDPIANLSGKIDLENTKYKLIYNQQARGGVKIEVKVNGSLRNNKSKIKRKEDLQIIWSKQFCETIVKSGKWYNLDQLLAAQGSPDSFWRIKEQWCRERGWLGSFKILYRSEECLYSILIND